MHLIFFLFQGELHGVDMMGPTPTQMETDNHVTIPVVDLPPDQLQRLAAAVNPLDCSAEYGVDLYLQAKLTLESQ